MNAYIFVYGIGHEDSYTANREIALNEHQWTCLDECNAIYKRINNEVVCVVSPNISVSPQDFLNLLKRALKSKNIHIQAWIIGITNHPPVNHAWITQDNCIFLQALEFNNDYVNPAIQKNDITNIRTLIRQRSLTLTDPLIIVVTAEILDANGKVVNYPEWVKAISSPKAQFYDDKLKKIDKINNQKQKEHKNC